jgi:N-acylneuraminate cytidylyltransferase
MVPVLRHAVLEMEQLENRRVNPIVLLQPTSPFRTVEDIDACIELFFKLDPEVVFSAQRAIASPYYNLVERIEDTPWVRLCKESKEVLWRRQDAPAAWISHGAVIVYEREALFFYEQHLWMKRKAVFEMSEERIFDIDSERDLKWAEFLLTYPEMGERR